MASSLDFVKYVCEQMEGAGDITYKKMFGEYGIYCDGKYCVAVCDDQVLVKITQAGKTIIPDCETAPPYEGAKPCFLISDLEDRDLLARLVRETCDALPAPKPKKKKTPVD